MDRHQQFLELFLRHQHDVRAFIGSVVRDWHRSEDIVQELATILWQKFDEYDAERPFGAWARGIAANLVLRDLKRQRQAMPQLSPEAVQSVLEAHDRQSVTESGPELEALRRCLQRLAEHARRLVRLRYGEDLGVEAIAERVGTTAAAAKKALTRIRAQLQQCVAERLAHSEDA